MKSFYYKQPCADDQVRATIAGEKTLMVLPVKIQPKTDQYVISRIACSTDRKERGKYRWVLTNDEKTIILKSSETFKSPFDVGERYWLKEAYQIGLCTESTIAYRSTHKREDLEEGWNDTINWRPSTHMPQWASRCTIEVKRVYVKKEKDIGEIERNRIGTMFERIAFDLSDKNRWCWLVEFEVVK